MLKEEKVRISNSSKKNDLCVVLEAQAALKKKLDGAKEIHDVAVAERVAAEKKGNASRSKSNKSSIYLKTNSLRKRKSY